jgi:lathosterol oxidase
MRRLADAAAYVSAFLGVMSLFGVAAFHFPEYLTTPRLREVYSEAQVRWLLHVGMLVAGACGALGVLCATRRDVAGVGLGALSLAWFLGGSDVSFESPVRTPAFYLSLDWVLLDLFLIATVFLSLERLTRRKREQPVLRDGWRVDLTHYVVNHILNGGLIYVISLPAAFLATVVPLHGTRATLAALPVVAQVVLIMVVTDFTQYWVHRAFHRVPWLWRFHAIHHSARVMDWLAGSRLHLVDVIATRSLSLIPMVVLGFSNDAINLYVPILALQSVFIHCNTRLPLGALRAVLATPQFHHWHHTADAGRLDRNFAVTLPVFDLLFGTYHCPKGEWPVAYGLGGGPDKQVSEHYVAQLVGPFRRAPGANA